MAGRGGGGGGQEERDEGVSKPKREAGSCSKQRGLRVVANLAAMVADVLLVLHARTGAELS